MECATKSCHHFTYVVIGGGIAGVSCVETLALLNENSDILLITSSDVVKTATSAVHLTKTIVELSIEEIHSDQITGKHQNVKILTDVVIKLNHSERYIETKNSHQKIYFKKLCICTGGRPNLIKDSNSFVIGIRDTESVVEFEKRIKSARKIMVVGNGGIASEIIHEVKGVDKIWVIKDNHITKTFIDAGAGEFFRESLKKGESEPPTIVKRMTYTTSRLTPVQSSISSSALGPDWHKRFELSGSLKNSGLRIEFECEVSKLLPGDSDWPVIVELTNGIIHGVDFVISATGVTPNVEVFLEGNENLKLGSDGGILVDWKMETSLDDVYAAGDVCTAGWDLAPHWHQMRLWTQARQMGMYSAKCMEAALNGQALLQDFCFEIFTHVTKLYGFKVILLGLFNGQKLGGEYELLLRTTKGKEFVKLVLKNGRLQGALLIGETDLEEMCENLILNQLDLTPYGEDLLNPDIDIEDYFD